VKIQLKASKNLQQKTDCLVVAFKPLKKIASQQAELNKITGGAIQRLQTSGQFEAKRSEFANLMVPQGIGAKQILLVGTGDNKKLDLETTRDLLIGVANKLKSLKVKEATFDLGALFAKSDIESVAVIWLKRLATKNISM